MMIQHFGFFWLLVGGISASREQTKCVSSELLDSWQNCYPNFDADRKCVGVSVERFNSHDFTDDVPMKLYPMGWEETDIDFAHFDELIKKSNNKEKKSTKSNHYRGGTEKATTKKKRVPKVNKLVLISPL